MIKKLVLLLLGSFFFLSCNSQELITKERLFGNWYILPNEKLENGVYAEVFIDSTYIYYYSDNLGMKPRSTYKIENNMLFHSRLGSGMEKFGDLKVSDSVFFVNTEKHEAVFKKIDKSFKLEDLIKNKITEDVYRKAFLERQQNWGYNSD